MEELKNQLDIKKDIERGITKPSDTETVLLHQPTTMEIHEDHQACRRINDQMGLSIFNFLCCCWIIGIASIAYSCGVRSAKKLGNYREARRKSEIAVRLNITGIVIGVVVIATVVILNYIFLKYRHDFF